ncbi:hypothetical protein C8F04DRAFT_1193229 [Mycena alexandri]|uniref:Uncharacterized protein n=1 Tax=Mycena alexandri TaxID=1745969 RepID=A0AAD6S9G9_9AGAR|nr:hypothetical protein C8F04DRAFT_1193229 [Mycena alexandri]
MPLPALLFADSSRCLVICIKLPRRVQHNTCWDGFTTPRSPPLRFFNRSLWGRTSNFLPVTRTHRALPAKFPPAPPSPATLPSKFLTVLGDLKLFLPLKCVQTPGLAIHKPLNPISRPSQPRRRESGLPEALQAPPRGGLPSLGSSEPAARKTSSPHRRQTLFKRKIKLSPQVTASLPQVPASLPQVPASSPYSATVDTRDIDNNEGSNGLILFQTMDRRHLK